MVTSTALRLVESPAAHDADGNQGVIKTIDNAASPVRWLPVIWNLAL